MVPLQLFEPNQTRLWLKLKAPDAYFSDTFVAQIAAGFANTKINFCTHRLYIDPHAISDELEKIEGRSPRRSLTKPPKEFKHRPLQGLWRKHWFQADFMMSNIRLEILRIGESVIKNALRKSYADGVFDGKIFTEDQAKAIAFDIAKAGYEDRAKRGSDPNYGRLTGEWIVYAPFNGKNYYLTLATHNELAHQIFKRCLPALFEFPRLNSHKAFSALNILGAIRESLR